MTECISCIKDATTGICRNIKDKTARELIEGLQGSLNNLQATINTLAGVDGGHLATDEDINTLQTQLSELSESVSSLDTIVKGLSGNVDGLATSEDIDILQAQINTINKGLSDTIEVLNNLDSTYATDEDITALQNQIDGLDSTYAKDSDITALQGQIDTIINSVNEIVEIINALDNTYAKGSDITALDTRVTALESGGSKKYLHNISMYNSNYPTHIMFSLITSDSSKYTTTGNIGTALKNLGFTSKSVILSATGVYKTTTSSKIKSIFGIYYDTSGIGNLYLSTVPLDNISSVSYTTIDIGITISDVVTEL